PSDDPAQVPEWFIGENAAVPLWWKEDEHKLSTETDPPEAYSLATKVALACRFDEEACEFPVIRYFYHGEGDPFTDGFAQIPGAILRDVGLFLLSSSREWDKLLSFSSSSLLKVLREYDALPGKSIEELKNQLRSKVEKVESSTPLSEILSLAEKELESFSLMGQSGRIVYRPTSLDTVSVLQSLIAHISDPDGTLIPIARHGAGMVSLQAFLLLLSFAKQRRRANRNFILAAEEPELHLHPSLHRRLVHRIRSSSVQSIVTTQSPQVASGYQPEEVVFIRNIGGTVQAIQARDKPISSISANSIKKLYTINRTAFYESLMGDVTIVPEGVFDFEWLNLLQKMAEAAPMSESDSLFRPITIVPTSDASVIDTYKEISRLRPDAIALIDGDVQGSEYATKLLGIEPPPSKIIQLGDDAAIECAVGWMLEPSLSSPGEYLSNLLPNDSERTLHILQNLLIERKKDHQFHENLAWDVLSSEATCKRIREFFHDIVCVASGRPPLNPGWIEATTESSSVIFKATHIIRV
ncbi:MAG: AAA family ATPase, partial [Nitrososphaerota archaeon]|nr:AAA family ATPase [Nitrososphaerota archaeon]